MERFPELRSPPPHDDPSEKLPMPSITALDWQADALVDLNDTETETDDPDWNDVAILIGSEIVRDVRAAIRAQLKYTCSAVCQFRYHSYRVWYDKRTGPLTDHHTLLDRVLLAIKCSASWVPAIRSLTGRQS